MALNLLKSRAAICAGSSLLVQTKLLNAKLFSDDSIEKSNLYEILGIPRTATYNEIKKAYYDLTLKYHPDRNENSEIAATKFRAVAEAYEVLGNYSLKKKYDQGLPLPIVKKHGKRTYENHRVKYQEFYDSRGTKTNSDARSEEINELGSQRRQQELDEEFAKKIFESRKKNHVVEFILALYIGILVVYNKFSS